MPSAKAPFTSSTWLFHTPRKVSRQFPIFHPLGCRSRRVGMSCSPPIPISFLHPINHLRLQPALSLPPRMLTWNWRPVVTRKPAAAGPNQQSRQRPRTTHPGVRKVRFGPHAAGGQGGAEGFAQMGASGFTLCQLEGELASFRQSPPVAPTYRLSGCPEGPIWPARRWRSAGGEGFAQMGASGFTLCQLGGKMASFRNLVARL